MELPDPQKDEPSLDEFRRAARRKRGGKISLRLTSGGVVLLVVANLVILGILAWPLLSQKLAPAPPTETPVTLTDTSTPTATSTLTQVPLTATPSTTPTASPIAPYPGGSYNETGGLIVLALQDGGSTHLFAYSPPSVPLTRLTSGPWEDIQPSLSADGRYVVFTSNRNGYWDLYQLEIATGALVRLTDTLAYDGSPCWSPDGLWLAYESYHEGENGGLDIYIRPLDASVEPIRLTYDAGADFSPAWSPGGRQIAFVTTRSGEPEIWIADLDKAEDERYTKISNGAASLNSHPVWSPDGNRLAWASVQDGYHNLKILDLSTGVTRLSGSGDWPAFSPDGKMLLAALFGPNQSYLAAYQLEANALAIPVVEMPWSIQGIAWGPADLAKPLSEIYRASAALTPEPLYKPALTPIPDSPPGRFQVVPLSGVEAPYAMLHDLADESFTALRQALAARTGWDLLSTLENAYVPLTSSLDPGRAGDWLYTGRAFEFTPLPLNAGWMTLVREDFGVETYWRVYLRVRYQDGSAGSPLNSQPWDFSSRYTGDTLAFEQGGKLAETIPGGYWLDFTAFALSYGWERIPAQSSWRSSYPAAHFNEYIYTEGLDWTSAMLEIYPPEALVIPTRVVPPTITPTPTPRWYQSPTPTITPSPRPTLTPLPSTATSTPQPSPTRTPTTTGATPTAKP